MSFLSLPLTLYLYHILYASLLSLPLHPSLPTSIPLSLFPPPLFPCNKLDPLNPTLVGGMSSFLFPKRPFSWVLTPRMKTYSYREVQCLSSYFKPSSRMIEMILQILMGSFLPPHHLSNVATMRDPPCHQYE
jgi:hypothetical protein